jgi:hypothetical protein
MPWTVSSPPRVAKNWSDAEKRRCVAAANRALRAGKSDEKAIFACIGAAGRSRRKERQGTSTESVSMYDELREQEAEELRRLARLLVDGSITLTDFYDQMVARIKQFHIQAALIAAEGRTLTKKDREVLEDILADTLAYLDKFVEDLQHNYTMAVRGNPNLLSDNEIIARAGAYSYAWATYTRYTIPHEIADRLPEFPGLSCLGGPRCGCQLEWEFIPGDYIIDEDGNVVEVINPARALVYWLLNPAKESCGICVSLAIEWQPYEVVFEEPIDLDVSGF